LNIVSLVLGQVNPDKFPIAVDAALHYKASDFFGDLQRLKDEDGLVCRDQEM
jgi:hypothetical protein